MFRGEKGERVQELSRTRARQLWSQLVQNQASPQTVRAALSEVPFEDRDAWVDLLWDVGEVPDDDSCLPRGCVPYLPCPVASVLSAIDAARVTSADVFVDIGSGLGKAAFLVHALTGASAIGLEIQPALVHAAAARAAELKLARLRFIETDAADWVRAGALGTVFFLYCPFSGQRLERVLDALAGIARTRRLRLCSVDLPAFECSWLEPLPSTSADLHVYQSRELSGR